MVQTQTTVGSPLGEKPKVRVEAREAQCQETRLVISQALPGTWSRSVASLLSVQGIPLSFRVKARAGPEWRCQPEKPQEGGLEIVFDPGPHSTGSSSGALEQRVPYKSQRLCQETHLG